MSAIGNFLGLNPSVPGVERPNAPRSLGRLSLAQLTKIRNKKRRQVSKLSGPDIRNLGGAFSGQRKKELRATTKRLKGAEVARESLIRRQTTARTGRATAISTLLTRGI